MKKLKQQKLQQQNLETPTEDNAVDDSEEGLEDLFDWRVKKRL